MVRYSCKHLLRTCIIITILSKLDALFKRYNSSKIIMYLPWSIFVESDLNRAGSHCHNLISGGVIV
jgi:hypothetical protein